MAAQRVISNTEKRERAGERGKMKKGDENS